MQKELAMKLVVLTFWTLMGALAFDKPIRGNKTQTTQTRTPGSFDAIAIHFPAKVTVTTKLMPKLAITTDTNLLNRIDTKIVGGTLRISARGWLKPSQTPEIQIHLPYLSRMETHGYGEYELRDIRGERLEIHNTVGDMVIHGQVEELVVTVNTGQVDAVDLETKRASIQLNSWGQVSTHVTDYLAATFEGSGTLLFKGDPEKTVLDPEGKGRFISLQDSEIQEKKDAVPHVSVRMFNNRMRLTRLLIEGPAGSRFSYGLSMGPLFQKRETYPIGTNIFLVKRGKENLLLHQIRVEDQNTVVSLFSKD